MPSVTHGPYLGDVGPNHIKVWLKVDVLLPSTVVSVEHILFGGAFPGTTVNAVALDFKSDNIVIIKLPNLIEHTRYTYRVLLDAVVQTTFNFWTLPSTTGLREFELYFYSDIHLDPDSEVGLSLQKQIMFSAMDNLRDKVNNPVLIFGCGDFGSIEPTLAESMTARLAILDNTFPDGDNDRYNFVRESPLVDMWDDADHVGNNTYGISVANDKNTSTMQAIHERVFAHPDTNLNISGLGFYKRIESTLILVPDYRSFRDQSPSETLKFSGSTALSKLQENWIYEVLEDNKDADFLLWICGTTMFDNIVTYTTTPAILRDSVGLYFKEERNRILKAINDYTKINHVICISGDDHYNKVQYRPWFHNNAFNPATEDPLAEEMFTTFDFDYWEIKNTMVLGGVLQGRNTFDGAGDSILHDNGDEPFPDDLTPAEVSEFSHKVGKVYLKDITTYGFTKITCKPRTLKVEVYLKDNAQSTTNFSITRAFGKTFYAQGYYEPVGPVLDSVYSDVQSVPIPPIVDLIKNGGFENGSTNWSLFGSAEVIADAGAFNGANVLKMISSSIVPTTGTARSDNAVADTSTEYKVSLWIKVDNAADKQEFKLFINKGGGFALVNTTVALSLVPDVWTLISHTFTPLGVTSALRLEVNFTDPFDLNQVEWHIDDVKMEPT